MKTIKILCTLMFLFLSPQAKADCQDYWFTYHSATLDLHVIYSEFCYQGKLLLQFTRYTPDINTRQAKASEMVSLPFDEECPTQKKHKDGGVLEFTCKKDGISPLAGATFRYKKFKTSLVCDGVEIPDIEPAFVCVKGCKPSTPKKLVIPVGEGCA